MNFKTASEIDLYCQIASRPFYTQKRSKFFAYGGHVSGYGFDSSAIKTPVFESISKLLLKLTFIAKLLQGLFTCKNP